MFIDTYISFDLETTGFSCKTDKIIEIGAVKVKNDEIIDEFNELIQPNIDIPKRITEITGITNEHLIGKRQVCEVLKDFQKFCGESMLLGHNIKAFDKNFINTQCMLNNIEWQITDNIIDTFLLSKRFISKSAYIANYKLDTLGRIFDSNYKEKHRALDDAIVAHKLFEYIKTIVC